MTHERPGFSLKDVVAIVIVVGILLMIYLVAARRGRDVTRAISCVGNLQQIAQALAHYRTTHGCYPLGVTASYNSFSAAENAGPQTPGKPTDWSGWSAHALMLNYLDQSALYDSLNFDLDPIIRPQEAAANATANATKVAVLLCPDDPYAGKPNLNSYYASIGTAAQATSHTPTGVFGYQLMCRSRDVTDGESNTVAFAEGLSGSRQARSYRGNGVVNVGAKFPDSNTAMAERYPKQVMENLKVCHDAFNDPAAPRSAFSGDRGKHWSWGAEAMTLFSTIVPPSSTQYAFNQCRYECSGCFLDDADHSDITNASSAHPGGANVVFCDGSVRFIKGSINMRTWWALGTRSSGDVVSSESF